MNKTILIIAIMFGFAPLQAQKKAVLVVPARAKAAFQKAYPDVNVVKWKKEEGHYEANFTIGYSDMTASYDSTGRLIGIEKDIPVSDLPAAIAAYFKKNMPGKEIKEASELKDGSGVTTYEAEVDGADYLFDAKGNFLKKEED
jgi:hypothetical protein